MGQISCEIIKDLLPLYYDEVCSKESVAIVEEHLAACQSCQMNPKIFY
ncbi:MAG TPA: zf-HC2 domain-containing protein [Paenibacillus sp.]